MPLEEFVTKARLLIEDGGYDPAAKKTTLRDTFVLGVTSDKVRKDAIALRNSLTFKQVYDLAKVDESTKAKMQIISKGEDKNDLHTVQRESPHSSQKLSQRQSYKHKTDVLRRPPKFNWDTTSPISVQVKMLFQMREYPRQISKLSCEECEM